MAVVLKCVPKTTDPLQPPQPPTEGKIILKDVKTGRELECETVISDNQQ